MKAAKVYYIPLHAEVLEVARKAAKSFDSLYTTINSHSVYFISAKFLDADAAEAAAVAITAFRNYRFKTGYYVEPAATTLYPYHPLESRNAARIRRPVTNKEPRHPLTHHGNIVNVPVGDFIPDEYYDLTHDVSATSRKFLPIKPSMHTSIQRFMDVFTPLEILNVVAYHGHHPSVTHEYLSKPIRELHGDLVILGKLILQNVIQKRPVTITIDGKVRELTVSVDGIPTDFSPKQMRGIVTLALLKYDHWFSLKNFSRIAFLRPRGEPRKDFEASLNVLKRYPPFDWDADEGIRRITGAVIESLVDRAVLRAFLR